MRFAREWEGFVKRIHGLRVWRREKEAEGVVDGILLNDWLARKEPVRAARAHLSG